MATSFSRPRAALFVGGLLSATLAFAQQPIGRTTATEVQVSGAVDITHGEILVVNGSAITAGRHAVNVSLFRGGALRICSTSTLHLSKDGSIADVGSTALMMALDQGAVEANYTVGKYSDVLLTPDLRILISGPGQADLRIRVNSRGDTCVDNRGVDAPYVTVSSQLEGGAYRVMPGQRVNFQNASLREVVDMEPEACGCPVVPPPAVASTGAPLGGPSSTPADTAFPIAQSEGLAPAPKPATPVVPAGETHAQVTVPLTYNGEAPPPAAVETPTTPVASAPAATPQAAPPEPAPKDSGTGVFHKIGRFFSRIFGGN